MFLVVCLRFSVFRMALSRPQYNIGDIVNYKVLNAEYVRIRDELCVIESIENEAGFNTFRLNSVPDGKKYTAAIHQIEPFVPMEMEQGDSLLDALDDDILLQFEDTQPTEPAAPEPAGTSPEPAPKRFKSVTTRAIDELASATTAMATDNQTKWAVRIIRGE